MKRLFLTAMSAGRAFRIAYGLSVAMLSSLVMAQGVQSLAIPSIQGSGSSSTYIGQTVITEGVVTAIFPGLQGYYLQDPVGDGLPETSDGIFVFAATSAMTVQVGQKIRLTGTVAEFNTVTELTSPRSISLLSSGHVIAPVDVALPEAVEGDLERFEGMLVRISSPMTVSQNYFQGRYGQVTLSARGRMYQPTQIFPFGSGLALALADENARSRLIMDDGSSSQNPNPIPYIGVDNTLRVGDVVTSLVGVIDHGLITNANPGPRDYKIHPTQPPVVIRSAPRPSVPNVGGNLKVVGFNVLNYFTTLDAAGSAGCLPSNTRADCRGADSVVEFNRQKSKIVAALKTINADVVGLVELQRNGNVAIQDLVNGLNAAIGANEYAVIAEPTSGVGTDAIKVGLIYKPSKLALIPATTLSDSDAIHNRAPVAQGFVAPNGERFSVIVNHFKSKSCTDAVGVDDDLGQGCFNTRRVAQAQQLIRFASAVKVAANSQRVLLIGDFNAYAQEDPMLELASAGYVDLARRFDPMAYSYIFDGASGTLDYGLASSELVANVVKASAWAINADEPFVIDYNLEFKPQDLYTPTPWRSSDHDPLIVGLSLVKAILGTPGRDSLVGTAGDDEIIGGEGADTITTGSGRDVVVYRSLRDAGDTITDFSPGNDRIDLTVLFSSAGFLPDAFATGHLRLTQTANGVMLETDLDGLNGPAAARPLVLLRGLTLAALSVTRDFIIPVAQPI